MQLALSAAEGSAPRAQRACDCSWQRSHYALSCATPDQGSGATWGSCALHISESHSMSFLSPTRYGSFLIVLTLASTLAAQTTAGAATDSAESHLGKGYDALKQ